MTWISNDWPDVELSPSYGGQFTVERAVGKGVSLGPHERATIGMTRRRTRGCRESERTLCRVPSMGLQMTVQTQAILSVLLSDPLGEHYGLEIAQAAGLASGSLYPALARLEREGWVTSDWEQVDQHQAGRPRRRYYRLTAHGATYAEQARVETIRRLTPARDRAVTPGLAGAR